MKWFQIGTTSPPALRILSLGGGVQSTVMCLLADQGAFGDKPDCAIFADTQWEPRAVYDNLRWLEERVSFPIITTSNGRSLRQDIIDGVNASGGPGVTLPIYLADDEGNNSGISHRNCTRNYKIVPIQKQVRHLLGLNARQTISPETRIEMWLGISTDESLRVKPSRSRWIQHRYPLIDDVPMTREECRNWFGARYPDRELTRSACIGCPFRSSSSWLDIRTNEPDLFDEAVEIDAMLRSKRHNAGRMFKKKAYLHRRRIPLAQAVSSDEAALGADGFANECEGYCGV